MYTPSFKPFCYEPKNINLKKEENEKSKESEKEKENEKEKETKKVEEQKEPKANHARFIKTENINLTKIIGI